MHAQSYANTPGYLFLIIGLTLSFISAFVPFFEAGYKLMTSVLIAGMLPYFVYAIAVPLSRSTMTTMLGLVIVITHALLVFNERFIGNADYSDNIIYYGPIIIAVTVLPLVIIAIKDLKSFNA
ncbi:MAG: hypothetical protein GQ572_02590 [Gammaproteobacteria bacterium]|nr:hypothetical protein [Gammaproteobacteria bacterium]